MKTPNIEDFYDVNDPRGISSSEYDDYLKTITDYAKFYKKNQIRRDNLDKLTDKYKDIEICQRGKKRV